MYKGQRRRNVETRFEAVALSVDLVASDAILRLNALYTSEGTLLRLDRSGTNRRVVKSSTVPVMVDRENVGFPVFVLRQNGWNGTKIRRGKILWVH